MEDSEAATLNKARKTEARHAAKALLRSANITEAPVVLNTIIKQVPQSFNLVIKGSKSHLPNGLDAFTYKDTGITIIGYNENVAVVRQRFSVAHELGHLYMGHLHGQSSVDLGSTDNDEVEANQFAAHLLMPTNMLSADIKSGLKSVDKLAKLYGVSEDAMWIQLSSTGLISKL